MLIYDTSLENIRSRMILPFNCFACLYSMFFNILWLCFILWREVHCSCALWRASWRCILPVHTDRNISHKFGRPQLCPRMRWDFIVIQTSAHWREDPLINTMLRLCVHHRVSIDVCETRVRTTDIDMACCVSFPFLKNEALRGEHRLVMRNVGITVLHDCRVSMVILCIWVIRCVTLSGTKGEHIFKGCVIVLLLCSCLTKHASKLRLTFIVWESWSFWSEGHLIVSKMKQMRDTDWSNLKCMWPQETTQWNTVTK